MYGAQIELEFERAQRDKDPEKMAQALIKGVNTLPKEFDKAKWCYPYLTQTRTDISRELNQLGYHLSNIAMHYSNRGELRDAYQKKG